MRPLFTFAAARRAKWLVCGLWFIAILAMFVAELPAKFTDAESNETTSYLPGDAESTEALHLTKDLADGEWVATVIVYRREAGLTPADHAKITADVAALNRATARFDNTTRFGNPRGPRAARPFELSKDGTTALIANEIEDRGEDASEITAPVTRYRELVSNSDGGLLVKVTGPAGVLSDTMEVFEGIGGSLLLAAVALVFVLLILIYRSPIFWILPLLAVGVAEVATRSLGFGLTELGVTVNTQSSSILSVLVLGAGTNYALLLVARYREELSKHEDCHEAMALALQTAGPTILASGLTVAAALLSLSLASVDGTAGLGPIGATGITVAMAAMLTLLPALLVIVGRRPFWPFIPHFGETQRNATHGRWRAVSERVSLRPRRVWLSTSAILAVLALGLINYDDGLTTSNSFREEVESVAGQELIERAFPAGQTAPTDLIVPDHSQVEEVADAASEVPGVAGVAAQPVRAGVEGVQLALVLESDPYSTESFEVIPDLRDAAQDVAPGALVGGPTAVEHDLRDAAAYDNRLLMPVVLVVVFLILMVLLRALVAPLLLIATVALSFAGALGVGAIVFDIGFGFPGSDPSLPLFAFIFLVALGVDYNIFLMARVREETKRHRTTEGVKRGLAVTGGVITAAGVVLAGTFSVLATLPLVVLTEIGFVVAFGVLLDALVVRSVLVPALVLDTGPRVWWPSTLARASHGQDARPGARTPRPA